MDILDLWPGCGVRSSKANAIFKPRRHVLVRPDTKFDTLLKPLAKSDPSYTLVKDPIYGKTDWPEFLKTYFPEQDTTREPKPGQLAKNDTLFVLANLPPLQSKKNHFTPVRWWSRFLEDSLRQTGLNTYGSVRLLVTMPYSEITTVLPRSAMERKRAGALTEALGLRCFEIASTNDFDTYHTWRGWEPTQAHTKQVAERAAAQNIVTRPHREFPPWEKCYDLKERDVPYVARVASPSLQEWAKAIADADIVISSGVTGPELQQAKKEKKDAVYKFVQDRGRAYTRHSLAEKLIDIEQKTRHFAHAAADPKETLESLQALDQEIETLRLSYTTELSEAHYLRSKLHTHRLDDDRVFRASQKLGHSQLQWEQRPFEPLLLHQNDIWPSGTPTSVFYYEPNEAPPILQKISHLPFEAQRSVMARFDAITSTLTQGATTVLELKNNMFPQWSTNEIVKRIPSLAAFAGKRLKPGHGPLPLSDPAADPECSYQENLDYDLSAVRLYTISAETFMDLALEYEKLAEKLPINSFSRLIGGTLTMSQLGFENLLKGVPKNLRK